MHDTMSVLQEIRNKSRKELTSALTNVTVALLESNTDGLTHLVGLGEPSAEADGGHLGASVEGSKSRGRNANSVRIYVDRALARKPTTRLASSITSGKATELKRSDRLSLRCQPYRHHTYTAEPQGKDQGAMASYAGFHFACQRWSMLHARPSGKGYAKRPTCCGRSKSGMA
ncbi:hypothetical protein L1887_56583 [Cichorium endivia]|nr:hypothetical protein L1887_56583 [Cichorium endivia]